MQIQLPKQIDSERLIIRPVALKYAEEAFEAMDDDVTKYLTFPTPKKVEETQDFVRKSLKGNSQGKDFLVFVFLKENNELIGGSGIHHIDTRKPEFGIWTKVASHGNHYGQETIKALKKWADDNLDYEYITYPVFEVNIPSRKIPEMLGGKVARHYVEKDVEGNEMHLVEYRIYR